VNSASSIQHEYPRMLLKALILGNEPALQAGFLVEASNAISSFHLYTLMGTALGVSRISCVDGTTVVFQLWSIPQVERLTGLSQQFRRGQRAAIIVLRQGEADTLEGIMENLSEESKQNFLVVIIGSDENAVSDAIDIAERIGAKGEIEAVESVQDVMHLLGENITRKNETGSNLPKVSILNETAVTLIEPPPVTSSTPNTTEEMEFIREQAEMMGARCTTSYCSIQLAEGEIRVDLKSGAASFTPLICSYCVRKCQKTTSICIVRTDEGWASEEVGQNALLAIAKIYNLVERSLPDHVEKQLFGAAHCNAFEIPIALLNDDAVSSKLQALGYLRHGDRERILKEEEKKVEEGYISRAVFNTLRRRLTRVEAYSRFKQGEIR